MGTGGVALGVGAIIATVGTLPVLGTIGVHPELLARVLVAGGAAATVIGAVAGRIRWRARGHEG